MSENEGDGSRAGDDASGADEDAAGAPVEDPAAADAEAVDDDHSADAPSSRHERVQRHPTTGPRNSMWHWLSARNPLRVMFNYAVIVVCRISPSLRATNWLLRRIGVDVGEGVSWGLESTPDVLWPELVTVRDDAIVGYDATLLCHEFLGEEYRTGEVVVGERAMIGAGAVLLPGVEVGEDAQVAANSLVAEDVPPETTVAGVPAEPVDGAVGSE